MAIPTNRDELIAWCLRKLGQPVIKVNVDATQIQDRVDDALYMFYKHNYEASETGYMLYRPTTEDIEKGYVKMPEDVIGVSDVYMPSNATNVFNVDFQMRLAEVFAISNTRMMTGISYYYTLKMHMDLLDELFKPHKTFEFNVLTKKLIILGGLRDSAQMNELLCFRVYKSLNPEINTDTNATVVNVWKNKWLQDYTTELIRRQWAQNLGKYQNIQLLGGVMMNGDQMMAMADEKIDKLEEQLRDEYELPPLPFVG